MSGSSLRCGPCTYSVPVRLSALHRSSCTVGGSANNTDYGTALDLVLTITLEPAAGGTQFKLVHDGFRSPQNDFGFTAMSSGWGTIVKRIDALLREAA